MLICKSSVALLASQDQQPLDGSGCSKKPITVAIAAYKYLLFLLSRYTFSQDLDALQVEECSLRFEVG